MAESPVATHAATAASSRLPTASWRRGRERAEDRGRGQVRSDVGRQPGPPTSRFTATKHHRPGRRYKRHVDVSMLSFDSTELSSETDESSSSCAVADGVGMHCHVLAPKERQRFGLR